MRIHHLDCGTMCPALGRLIGGASLLGRGLMVCHCVLLETQRDGLILVDTGFGTPECLDRTLFPRAFQHLIAPRFALAETAFHQVRALGFSPADVRHIVLTHLDVDHAGGLPDFPTATIHLHQRELEAAKAPTTLRDKNRYVPRQWAHHPKWTTYAESGDTWLGLPAVRKLRGVEADIALVPLPGHTRGHSAIAIAQPSGWLLHAGDAYFYHQELADPRDAPIGYRALQAAMEVDPVQRSASQTSLRRLHREHPEVTIMSAHDPMELARERLAARQVS